MFEPAKIKRRKKKSPKAIEYSPSTSTKLRRTMMTYLLEDCGGVLTGAWTITLNTRFGKVVYNFAGFARSRVVLMCYMHITEQDQVIPAKEAIKQAGCYTRWLPTIGGFKRVMYRNKPPEFIRSSFIDWFVKPLL
ncbi:MAG: hypothetical protein H6550_16245 [Chitinophagales bacterium]|nr:hypothetical protein [Chitinophagales bacterium]